MLRRVVWFHSYTVAYSLCQEDNEQAEIASSFFIILTAEAGSTTEHSANFYQIT
jgi:hypothetical protein